LFKFSLQFRARTGATNGLSRVTVTVAPLKFNGADGVGCGRASHGAARALRCGERGVRCGLFGGACEARRRLPPPESALAPLSVAPLSVAPAQVGGCLCLAGGFVASLYLWRGATVASRDEPATMKKRMLSVGAGAPLCAACCCGHGRSARSGFRVSVLGFRV